MSLDLDALEQLEIRAGLDWNLDNAHPLLMAFGPMRREIEDLRAACASATHFGNQMRAERNAARSELKARQ